ncbi:MAG: hypothetical protein J3Q66DRAFT_402369 [Benniella sp.]|nr:MAG: hypothetical protein J3Q66DRAFT_402369 [Benniella sp.]
MQATDQGQVHTFHPVPSFFSLTNQTNQVDRSNRGSRNDDLVGYSRSQSQSQSLVPSSSDQAFLLKGGTDEDQTTGTHSSPLSLENLAKRPSGMAAQVLQTTDNTATQQGQLQQLQQPVQQSRQPVKETLKRFQDDDHPPHPQQQSQGAQPQMQIDEILQKIQHMEQLLQDSQHL